MMKRRDSVASLFSGHGSRKPLEEDEGLLTNSEDVSPANESDLRHTVHLFDRKDDFSGSWYTVEDSEPEDNDCPEFRDQKVNFADKRQLGSRERLNRSLSNLFLRVSTPKIHSSRKQCFLKQLPESKKTSLLQTSCQVNLNWKAYLKQQQSHKCNQVWAQKVTGMFIFLFTLIGNHRG